MRLPDTAHTSRPWRIHELTPDFDLEDVWALPGTGGADDFLRLVQGFASSDPSEGSGPSRALFALRWKLGELFGWDREDDGLGSRVPTLRDRLPADLREGPTGPEFSAVPFKSLYMTDDEFAAEVANRTMHGVLHLGRVPDAGGGYTCPDGRAREAERAVREDIHARDQAVPAPDRLPGHAASDGRQALELRL